MKPYSCWYAAAFSLALLLMGKPAQAQMDNLAFDADRVPNGRVMHFVKSQRDGSHAARISVYVSGDRYVESLKWSEGGTEATVVKATMDWSRFSVSRFEAWHLQRGSAPALRVTLEVNGDQLTTSLFDRPMTLSHFPWHSYDFDFTSLALSLPHAIDPKAGLKFWRTDYVHGPTPSIQELGEVSLRFERMEKHGGLVTRRYTLSGAGLGNSAGTWWSDARTGLLVEYELPVGDEPGYDDVRLRAIGSQFMSPAAWEKFKRRAVGE